MEDLTGLGKVAESVAKIADTQLANKAYDDLAASPMREGGKGLADLVKAFRLFLAPIQLLAVAQDRLAAFCGRVRAKVPEDRQQEALPSIALPVLMDLRFMEDENPLTELYLNLLARAIDKERCSEAHPAFVKIIEQMSPDEALVMLALKNPVMRRQACFLGDQPQGNRLPLEILAYPAKIQIYASHLESLNLVDHSSTLFVQVTEFGNLFIEACIPDEFDVAEFKGDQPGKAD